MEEFTSLLDTLILHPSQVVLTGDFNIWVDDSSNSHAQQFTSLLSTYVMKQHVTGETHLHGHTLDLLITRASDNIISNVSVILDLSDHNAVQCNLNLTKPPPLRKTVTTRPLQSIDREQLQSGVHRSLSSIDFVNSDVSSCVERYGNSLSILIDQLAPKKTRTVVIKPSCPWMTEEIHAAKCLRRRLERKWRKTKCDADRDLYSKQRQAVSKKIETAKTHYYSQSVADCMGDPKRLFSIADTLMHRKNEPILPDTSCNQTLAEKFSQFFVNKITMIHDVIDLHGEIKTNRSQYSAQGGPSPSTILLNDFMPSSTAEVKKVIMSSPTSSCELDQIPTGLLKEHVDIFAPYIAEIVNKSLHSATFPACMQHALVKPLLKKPRLDKHDLASYRPVANLSFLSKVIERVVSVRLQSYLKDNNFHDNFQSAYRENHSVETALLRVQNDILTAMDGGKVTGLILLDLSGAFDTVDHIIMLERLQQIGIGGKALKWFRSYLSKRSQAVCVRDATSNTVHLKFSVPQGSVLGPKLFNIYTLPLHDIIKKHNLSYHIYADDTQLYFSCPLVQEQLDRWISCTEACISDIRKWMRESYLKLNDAKTEFLLLGSKQQIAKLEVQDVRIGNTSISRAGKVRDLGVIFDSNMTMESQVSNCVKLAFHSLRNIRLIRKYLTPMATEQLVHAFITSRIDCCNCLLIGHPNYLIQKLKQVQNAAARLVTNTRKYSHITPVLRSLHWLPVEQRLEYKVLLITFRALKFSSPEYIASLIHIHKSNRSGLRSSSDFSLVVPKSKRSWGDRAFASAAPRLWNKLPNSIKTCATIDNFKSKLKSHLMTRHI